MNNKFLLVDVAALTMVAVAADVTMVAAAAAGIMALDSAGSGGLLSS